MNGIGSIGYAVRVSEQGKGYGTEILKQGFRIAKEHGMDKVLMRRDCAENAQQTQGLRQRDQETCYEQYK